MDSSVSFAEEAGESSLSSFFGGFSGSGSTDDNLNSDTTGASVLLICFFPLSPFREDESKVGRMGLSSCNNATDLSPTLTTVPTNKDIPGVGFKYKLTTVEYEYGGGGEMWERMRRAYIGDKMDR